MKVRDLIKLIEADGWYRVSTAGSHRQYKHPEKPGRVTVAGHPNDDVHLKRWQAFLDRLNSGNYNIQQVMKGR